MKSQILKVSAFIKNAEMLISWGRNIIFFLKKVNQTWGAIIQQKNFSRRSDL